MLNNAQQAKVLSHYARLHWKKEFLCICYLIISAVISLLYPLLFRIFIDDLLPGGNTGSIVYFVAAFLFISVAGKILSLFTRATISRVENSIITDIRTRIYENVLCQRLSFFRDNGIGPVLQKTTGDVEAIRSLWGFLFPTAVSSIISFLITFTIIVIFNWKIALLSLITIVLYVAVFKLYNEKIRDLFFAIRKTMDRMNTRLTETWAGIKEVKSFQLEHEHIRKFGEVQKQLANDNLMIVVQRNLSSQLMDFASMMGPLVVLGVGGYYVMIGEMSVGTLIALHMYITRLYQPSRDIADILMDFRKYSVSVSRFRELMELAKDEQSASPGFRPPSFNGNIVFDHVSFMYGNNSVLSAVSFQVKKGSITALVGKTGTGKSTITNLLLGFITPSNGAIRFGEKDIKELPLRELRSSISLVSQDVYLFNASIYDNIRIGNLDASDEEIDKVAKELGIDTFAGALPDKLHTIIAENGKNLSGGQIQRIAIARALLKDAPILIFDEATSSIDSETESLVQLVMSRVKRNKYIIIVSHRLSSLKHADEIIVLRDGRITEHCTKDIWVNMGNDFKELFKEQLS